GVDFLGNQGITLRLIVEPTGVPSLRFFEAAHPLNPGTLFRRQDCSRFELSLEHTHVLINDIRDLPVSLTFECRTASGESAAGHLVADHCHRFAVELAAGHPNRSDCGSQKSPASP